VPSRVVIYDEHNDALMIGFLRVSLLLINICTHRIHGGQLWRPDYFSIAQWAEEYPTLTKRIIGYVYS